MYTKKYFIAGIAAAIALGAAFSAINKKPEYVRPTAGENIVFFGDSLVSGVGAEPGQDIVSSLSRLTGFDIINAGKAGDTTVSALLRLNQDVLSRNPKVVIVLLGGNDFLQRIPAGQTEQSIRLIVERILAAGSGVILINEDKILASNRVFGNLAKEKRIPYIQNLLGEIRSDRSLMSDPIHPNSQGYAAMAGKIQPVLENYLDGR